MKVWKANDPALVVEVMRLADEGVTYSEIGNRLGITKNTAIGIAKRRGVPDRIEIPAKPRPPTIQIPEGPVCRWIFGHVAGADTRFCGKPGYPWCAEHRAVAYTKAPPR